MMIFFSFFWPYSYKNLKLESVWLFKISYIYSLEGCSRRKAVSILFWWVLFLNRLHQRKIKSSTGYRTKNHITMCQYLTLFPSSRSFIWGRASKSNFQFLSTRERYTNLLWYSLSSLFLLWSFSKPHGPRNGFSWRETRLSMFLKPFRYLIARPYLACLPSMQSYMFV